MKRIAVVGGGISGLSACFYLNKLNPEIELLLFEKSKLGGWIQTMTKDNFIFETGPRSIRVSAQSRDAFEIIHSVGMLEHVMLSKTKRTDACIYADDKMIEIVPSNKNKIMAILGNPLYRRMILAYLLKKKPNYEKVDDESIEAFVRKSMKFWNDSDREYFISTYLDAFQTGVYSGDMSKLSARSCPPFTDFFLNKNFPDQKIAKVSRHEDPEVEQAYQYASYMKSNAFNFTEGLTSFINAILDYLQRFPNFKYIPRGVASIEKYDLAGGKVVDEKNETYKVDHVITTIPSYQIPPILKGYSKISDLCKSIPHNSIFTMNAGFGENHGLKGVGYLIPKRQKSVLSGVLYDSAQFPLRRPSLSIMGPAEKFSPELQEVFLKEFQKHTGVTLKPSAIISSFCEKSLPQYNVGHYKIVKEIEEKSPSWLHISGQSIYRSGIPNCILTSKELAYKLANVRIG